MNKLKTTLGVCLAILTCGPCAVLAEGRGYDSVGGGNILVEEVSRQEHVAREVSSKHAVARLEADELMERHKYGWARHTMRKAQELLISRRNETPASVFTMLDTLGQDKLNEIDAREIRYLRQRLAGERPSSQGISRKPEAVELPTPEKSKPSGVTVTAPAAYRNTRTVKHMRGPVRRGLGTLVANVDYEEYPLEEVLDDLREKSGDNIVANWQSLNNGGIDKDTPVSLKLRNVSAGRILKAVLQNLSSSWSPVSYIEHNGIVVIATAEDLARIIDTRVYDITHLLMETKDLRGGRQYDAGGRRNDRSRDGGSNDRSDRNRDSNSSRSDQRNDSPRTSVGSSSGSRYDGAGSVGTDRTQEIIDIVLSSAPADSWRENGGPGSVAVFGTRIVITQTAENHAKIAMALALLGW